MPLLSSPWRRQAGFTMIELLVVLAIIAIATGGASLALRDSAHNQIDREAVRLSALLESARAQSRASGVPVLWQAGANGFRFVGLPPEHALPTQWLHPVLVLSGGEEQALRTGAEVQLVLGPDPILPPQQLTIAPSDHPDIQRTLSTNGIQPFQVAAPGLPR